MRILIGLPVYQRAWILPYWFRAIENQTIPLSDIGFIFELGPNDQMTHDILWQWHMDHPQVWVFDGVIHEEEKHSIHTEGQRAWRLHDFSRMVNLRNHLLDRAIALDSDVYFSLDSDILLENPNTLSELCSIIDADNDIDAVNTLSYMWPDQTDFPSVMTWVSQPGGSAFRDFDKYQIGSLFKSDIIMASVMMSKKVYSQVRYKWHRQGEDLGWSLEATRCGFNLYCASNLYTPHIMHQAMLTPYLENGDPRSVLKPISL